MFAFIEFLKKRPADRTILLGRIAFGAAIALLLGINFTDISLHLPDALDPYELWVKYALFILAVIPVFMGATNFCIAKRKSVRIMQWVFWLLLILIGNALIALPDAANNVVPTQGTGAIDYEKLDATEVSRPVNVGFWLALLGILPLLAGISGKCITSKCMKYGEVIKKIRV